MTVTKHRSNTLQNLKSLHDLIAGEPVSNESLDNDAKDRHTTPAVTKHETRELCGCQAANDEKGRGDELLYLHF